MDMDKFFSISDCGSTFFDNTRIHYGIWLEDNADQLPTLIDNAIFKTIAEIKEINEQTIRKHFEKTLIEEVGDNLRISDPEDIDTWTGIFILAFCEAVASNIQIQQSIKIIL